MEKYVVKTRDELIKIIKESSVDADLNHLDVSLITDMSFIFCGSDLDVSDF